MVERRVEKFSPYSVEQLYNMVIDVESYPEFIPWCVGARILEDNGDDMIADLIISFSGFREKYTSKVIKAPYNSTTKEASIIVDLVEGPFKFLKNSWVFKDIDGKTKIDFYISFSFSSKLLEKLIGLVFEKASVKMVNSFELRAEKLFAKKEINIKE